MYSNSNISVKDQRLKDYHPPILFPKNPHNSLVEISREKNQDSKYLFYSPYPSQNLKEVLTVKEVR